MNPFTIPENIILRLSQKTAQLLEGKQEELASCSWTNGESNTEGDYSRLACRCVLEAWSLIQSDFPGMENVIIEANSPDISCIFKNDSLSFKRKIELKSSLNVTMPGSTIGKLDFNQPMIYCLRPKNPTEPFKFRYSQYHHALGENDKELFQDRTPRPIINYDKMWDSSVLATYTEKEKSEWVDHYAVCALNRLNTPTQYSWQDSLVRKIKDYVIKTFLSTTTIEEIARMKVELTTTHIQNLSDLATNQIPQ